MSGSAPAWLASGPAHHLMDEGATLVWQFIPAGTEAARRDAAPVMDALNRAIERAGGPLSRWRVADPAPLTLRLAVPNLQQLDASRGRMTAVMACLLGAELLQYLAPYHDEGVVHGAISPKRIVWADSGDLALLEWGAAAFAQEQFKPLTTGTPRFDSLYDRPGWVPPELFSQSALTVQSDIYSVALTVLWALTGRPPFGTGATLAIYGRVRAGRRPAVADLAAGLPVDLSIVLERALSTDPAQRPDLKNLHDALHRFAEAQDRGGLAAQFGTPGPWWPADRPTRAPEDAPGIPGSPQDIARQKRLQRMSVTLDIMRTKRGGGRSGRSRGRMPLFLLLIAGAAFALIMPCPGRSATPPSTIAAPSATP